MIQDGYMLTHKLHHQHVKLTSGQHAIIMENTQTMNPPRQPTSRTPPST